MITSTALDSPNGVFGQSSSSAWLSMTLREFFTQINWADQPPEIQAIQLTALQGDRPELSLQLTVNQFFAAIPWDGKTAAAPLDYQDLSSPAVSGEPEFTVDDFAGLF